MLSRRFISSSFLLKSLAALTSFTLTHTAYAESMFEPSISGEVVVEWQNENTFKSDEKANEFNHMFGRMEVAPTIGITEHLYVDGVLVTEPFDQAFDKNPDKDIYFESEGTFIEEMKLNYARDGYAVWAGKFNPAFGRAWDYGRGIWSEDFAEDYEITEKLGVGASYTYENEPIGEHTLSANTFFNDTSLLSGAVITSRDRTKKEDGGAGNTEDFSSFNIALDGQNIGGIENLGYHLGYRHLGQGDADFGSDFDDEQGYVAGLDYAFAVHEDVGMDALIEYASISNFGGFANNDVSYLSASLITTFFEKWNVTFGYTDRSIDESRFSESYNDYLLQATAGYNFGNGFTLEAGYRGTEEANIHNNGLGFLVRYTKAF